MQDRLEIHGVDYQAAAAAASIFTETVNNELINDKVYFKTISYFKLFRPDFFLVVPQSELAVMKPRSKHSSNRTKKRSKKTEELTVEDPEIQETL